MAPAATAHLAGRKRCRRGAVAVAVPAAPAEGQAKVTAAPRRCRRRAELLRFRLANPRSSFSSDFLLHPCARACHSPAVPASGKPPAGARGLLRAAGELWLPGERGRQLELSKNESEIAAPAIDRQRGAGTHRPPRAPAASARLISVGSPKRGHHHPVLLWLAGLFCKKWAGGAAASTALIVGCASREGFGQNPEPSVQSSGGRGLTAVAGG